MPERSWCCAQEDGSGRPTEVAWCSGCRHLRTEIKKILQTMEALRCDVDDVYTMIDASRGLPRIIASRDMLATLSREPTTLSREPTALSREPTTGSQEMKLPIHIGGSGRSHGASSNASFGASSRGSPKAPRRKSPHGSKDRSSEVSEEPSPRVPKIDTFESREHAAIFEDATSVHPQQELNKQDMLARAIQECLVAQAEAERIVATVKSPNGSVESEPHIRGLLKFVDRYGQPEQHPKSVRGGLMTLLWIGAVIAYTAFSVIAYMDAPPVEVATIKWSVWDGPFPITFTCYSEQCWVSQRYVTSACSTTTSASHTGVCLLLAAGESITLDTCYSQFITDGVRVHFGGAPAWGKDASQYSLDAAAQLQYGMVVRSEMRGMSDASPIALTGMPIKSGAHLQEYVVTHNETAAQGGQVRHEWFLIELEDTAEISYFAEDPCIPILPQSMNTRHAALVMSPRYTDVMVTKPSFMLAVLGEVGGAAEVFDVVLGIALRVLKRLESCGLGLLAINAK